MKLTGALTLLLFCGLLAFPSVAADKIPQPRDCEADFPADQYNDRIDCKNENVNAALFDYVDSVIDAENLRRALGRDPLFTDTQMDHLMAARDRAQSAKNRSHAAQAFRGPARKQKAQDADCYVKEIIGDGKGNDIQPCEKNEDCEEVLGDDIGDDDGICRTKGNPNLREVCVQVCQQPLLDDDENYDPEAASDMEQGLGELETALDDATNEVKLAMARMQQYYATRPAAEVDECDMFEFDLFPGPAALQTTQVVKNIADAAFNGCSVVCNQDAFGWNCEAVCLGLAIVSGVASSVNDGFSVADGTNGSAQLDRVAKCTRQLDEGLDGVSGAVQGTQDGIDDLKTRVDALSSQVDQLMKFVQERFLVVEDQLCTPQGQRECFPDGVQSPAEQVRGVRGKR